MDWSSVDVPHLDKMVQAEFVPANNMSKSFKIFSNFSSYYWRGKFSLHHLVHVRDIHRRPIHPQKCRLGNEQFE
jgi:hypothetical protein